MRKKGSVTGCYRQRERLLEYLHCFSLCFVLALQPFDKCRFRRLAPEPFPSETFRGRRIKLLAGEDIDVHGPQEIESMNHYRAGEDKTNGGGAFRLRRGLLLVLGHTDIVPEMHLAFFHVDEVAKF